MNTQSKYTAQLTAKHNDQLRARLQVPVFGIPEVPGTFVMTSGINSLSPEDQICICAAVRDYDNFNDDLYGKHDFGSIDYPNLGKVFWKIDYYANAACMAGSEYPFDPTRSYRVLTIMLAEEY